VIMPGIYTEPGSRAVPAFPKDCDQYRTTSDHGAGAVSYEYQYHCPNAQSLVAVIGRGLQLRLGSVDQIDLKLQVAVRVLRSMQPATRSALAYVDISVPGRPALGYKHSSST